MVRASVLHVKSRLLSLLPGWSHVPLNCRSTVPVCSHLFKSTLPPPPPGVRAVKSALNPGFGRVKPPLCPGARGAGISMDWCISTNKFFKDYKTLHKPVGWVQFVFLKKIASVYLFQIVREKSFDYLFTTYRWQYVLPSVLILRDKWRHQATWQLLVFKFYRVVVGLKNLALHSCSLSY